MVLPAQSSADAEIPADVARALGDGARLVTPNVARATASLADTAVIVGCDPAERACLDSVAAALNVDQMLLVTVRDGADGEVTVEVTAVSRDADPITRQFVLKPATRKQDLAAMQAAVPAMLDADAAAQVKGGGDAGNGSGDAGNGSGDAGNGSGDAGNGSGDAGNGSGDTGIGGGGGLGSSKAPMVLTIAGGAVALVGLGAWGMAAIKQGDIDDAPTATAEDLDRLVELEGSARRYASAGNAMVLAGGITAAAGAIWWWRAGRTHDAAPAPAPAATPAGLTLTPIIGRERTGLVLGGRW